LVKYIYQKHIITSCLVEEKSGEKSLMKRTLLPEIKEHFSRRAEQYVSRHSPDFHDNGLSRCGRVLEIGCGAKFSFKIGFEKYGIDITPDLLAGLKRREQDINLILADARYLPFVDKSFEVVGAVFVLHHLVGDTIIVSKNNICKSLNEMVRVSTKEGHILIIEHLCKNKLFSNLFFYVTWICARLDLDLNYLDIHDKVVTFYLDFRSFERIIEQMGLTTKISSSRNWRFRGVNLGEDKEISIQRKSFSEK
jgi:ubiquinone/menaquinone biosynthesis C-methylase UbiE